MWEGSGSRNECPSTREVHGGVSQLKAPSGFSLLHGDLYSPGGEKLQASEVSGGDGLSKTTSPKVPGDYSVNVNPQSCQDYSVQDPRRVTCALLVRYLCVTCALLVRYLCFVRRQFYWVIGSPDHPGSIVSAAILQSNIEFYRFQNLWKYFKMSMSWKLSAIE